MKNAKLILLVMFGAAEVLTAAAPARAGDWQYQTVNVPSALSSVNNGTSNSVAGTAFTIPANTAIAFEPSLVAADSGTSNVVHRFNLSTDGTNFSTPLPISITNAANGTTAVVGWNLITAAQLNGAKYGRLDQVITTQTNAVTTSAIHIGFYY